MLDNRSQLSKTTLTLHWLVGLMMISLLSIGIYMTETKAYGLYNWHKSFGVLIVVLVLPRIVWRIKNGWPSPAGDYRPLEQVLAKIAHWVLILGTILMPISGMMMSGLGGHGIPIFGVELLASQYDPETQQAIAINGQLAGIAHTAHGIIGYAIVAALLLHISGALKHHIIDKDGTLKRMLGKRI